VGLLIRGQENQPQINADHTAAGNSAIRVNLRKSVANIFALRSVRIKRGIAKRFLLNSQNVHQFLDRCRTLL
jgi:hypothetical protein